MTKTLSHSLYPFSVLILVLIASFFTASPALSADPKTSRFVGESVTARAEVKLLYPKNAVEVSLLDRDRLGLPDAIQISLLGPQGERMDLELTAIPSESLSGDLANQRKYVGQIPSGYDSYVGLSLKIPFTRSPKATTLRLGKGK